MDLELDLDLDFLDLVDLDRALEFELLLDLEELESDELELGLESPCLPRFLLPFCFFLRSFFDPLSGLLLSLANKLLSGSFPFPLDGLGERDRP
jgi:hypothetical protein